MNPKQILETQNVVGVTAITESIVTMEKIVKANRK
jgi:hypothetical protein